jgi:Ca2+-binding RTX toxin-like protein
LAITTQPGASSSDFTTLLGTSGNDQFALTDSNLLIDGLAGADTVTAADTLDTIKVLGGSGNDNVTFSGALQKGFIRLDKGNDKLVVSKEFDGEVFGGQGVDDIDFTRGVSSATIQGDNGNDTIDFATSLASSVVNGGSDDDQITVATTVTSATINGGTQQDTITLNGALENSKVKGDSGIDSIDINANLTGTIVNGNADNDNITITAASITNSTVYGGSGNDTVSQDGAGAAYLDGSKGNDSITANTNAKHTLVGGDGNDTISATGTSDVLIQAGAGNDQVTTGNGKNTIELGDGNNTLTADGSGNSTITSGTGKDSITTTSGGDKVISTGAGVDTVVDGAGKSNISTSSGKDTITSGGGNDSIKAGADDDTITLTVGGNVVVNGGKGKDTIATTTALLTFEDTISGDVGDDILKLDAFRTATVINAAYDVNFTNVSGIKTFDFNESLGANTATVVLGSKAEATGLDTITSTSAGTGAGDGQLTLSVTSFTKGVSYVANKELTINDDFTGGAGNDTVTGGAAGDLAVTGGKGVDTITLTSGTNTVSDLGIGGADVLVIGSGATVTATVGADWTASSSTINNNSVAGGRINATGFDVDLTSAGGTFGFRIDGNATAATLVGSGLVDDINGGDAAESLVGGGGNDDVNGGNGADTIDGGAGNDALTGGAAGDLFKIDSGSSNTIADFGDAGDVLTVSSGAGVAATMDTAIILAATTINNGVAGFNYTGANAGSVSFAAITGTNGISFTNSQAAKDVSVVGSSKADTITAATFTDTIQGGGGADSIVVTDDGGNDVVHVQYAKVTDGGTFSNGSSSSGDVITGFVTASDKISFLGEFATASLTGTALGAANAIANTGGINFNASGSGDDSVQVIAGAAANVNTLADAVNVTKLNTAIGSITNEASDDERILIFDVHTGGFAAYYYAADGDGTIEAGELTLLATSSADMVLGDIVAA